MYDVGILSLPKSFVMSCLLSMPVSVAAFAWVLHVINNSNPFIYRAVLASWSCTYLVRSRVKMSFCGEHWLRCFAFL